MSRRCRRKRRCMRLQEIATVKGYRHGAASSFSSDVFEDHAGGDHAIEHRDACQDLAEPPTARTFDGDNNPAAFVDVDFHPRHSARCLAETPPYVQGSATTTALETSPCDGKPPLSRDLRVILAPSRIDSSPGWAWRSKHDLIHPNEKSVAADDPYGDDGPYGRMPDEKSQQLPPPFFTREGTGLAARLMSWVMISLTFLDT